MLKRIFPITSMLKVAAFLAAWGIILLYLASPSFASSHSGDLEIYHRLASGERMLQAESNRYATPEQPTVYITFDDGPSEHTNPILDILKKEQVKATFFVLGQASEKHPETVRRIVEEGHRLGNHTYDHRYENLYSGFDQYWAQVQRTDEILQEIAGVSTRLHRAPGGTHSNFDAFYYYYMDQAGYEIFDWNVDSGDARRRGVPASEIVANVRNSTFSHEVHLLLHDSQGHAETVKALPKIIDFFREKGYVFAPLSEDVKPVHHSLGQSKWDRHMHPGEHTQMLAAVGAVSEVRSFSPSGIAGEMDEAEPLQLKHGSETYSFDSDSYFVEQGHIQISLRAWSEERNINLHWNQKEKVAYLQHQHQLSLWKPAKNEVSVRNATTHYALQTWAQANMQLVDGRLYVPLRTLLDMDGMMIQRLNFTDQERTILVQPTDWKQSDFQSGNIAFLTQSPFRIHGMTKCLRCYGTYMV